MSSGASVLVGFECRQRVDGRHRAVPTHGQLSVTLPTFVPDPLPRTLHRLGLAAPLSAARLTSTSAYLSTLNLNLPRKLICEKCGGPIRRDQSSSMPTQSRLSCATTPSMRLVFQASAMWVSSACAPEIAAISCRRRPRSGATWPP